MKVVGHIPAKNVFDKGYIGKAIELGIGVELQLMQDVLDNTTLKDFANLREMLGNRSLTIHAPFIDLNPGAYDKRVLEVTRNRFDEAVVASYPLKAEVIVFHTGFHPSKTCPIYDTWFERTVETFTYASSKARCRMALENVFDESPIHIKRLLSELPRNVGACIDVGHANIFSDVPIGDWIEEFKGRIYELHLHDNKGKKDEHAPIGTGNVDFKTIFSKIHELNQDCIVNLESKNVLDLISSFKAFRGILDENSNLPG